MPWSDQLVAVPMARVAIVAPFDDLRRVLVETAAAGVFEPDERPSSDDHHLVPTHADKDALARVEHELDEVTASAVRSGTCAIVPGWMPRQEVDALQATLDPLGGAVVEMAPRRGLVPPTAPPAQSRAGALRPLVSTYATVPYRDLDPTWFAAIAYMVMFGAMFGDVGHGLGLVGLGAAARWKLTPQLRRLSTAVPFLLGAGVAAVFFGLLYGEAFGPTGLVPTLWLRPLDAPETVLLAGLIGGTCLIALTFVLAAINRWREGGPALAIYATSGIAGALLFAGAAVAVGGVLGPAWLLPVGLAVFGLGAVLTFIGLLATAGRGSAGVAQAIVELFDTVLRLGSNVVSFTRLAAFGLTHAVITGVVWDGTDALWDRGSLFGVVSAIALFAVGNLVAFGLGALVGAIQALRLEYYELFSRLFAAEGRPFVPWRLSVERSELS